jgi:hypothetical protein
MMNIPNINVTMLTVLAKMYIEHKIGDVYINNEILNPNTMKERTAPKMNDTVNDLVCLHGVKYVSYISSKFVFSFTVYSSV